MEVPPGGGGGFAGPVPAGYLWVVRDVVAWDEGPPHLSVGWTLYTGGGSFICGVDPSRGRARTAYHWEGRQVVETGDTLNLNTTSATMTARVTGYVLTLP